MSFASNEAFNSYDIFMRRIDEVWRLGSHKMEWLKLEQLMVDILKCTQLTDSQRIDLIKQSIDAHTRRGHFV